jgi:leucyl/phenylalanyl-tRNA---protein transferase
LVNEQSTIRVVDFLGLRGPTRKVLGKAHRLLLRLLAAHLKKFPAAKSELICCLEGAETFTAEQVLLNYAQGLFPLGGESGIRWTDPAERAVIPLDDSRVEKEAARIIRQFRQKNFVITFDQCFREVVAACADRSWTWITPEIMDIYEELHRWGIAHSFELWQEGQLVGGNYGTALGNIYLGESMFHRVSNAGKVAFAHQIEHLRRAGFKLFDFQNPTEFHRRFRGKIISRSEYRDCLARALAERTPFGVSPRPPLTETTAEPIRTAIGA